MKDQQRQAACELYLSSDFTVTEIANHLGIGRRSVQLWAKKENWNALRNYISRHVETQDFASVRYLAFSLTIYNSMFRSPVS